MKLVALGTYPIRFPIHGGQRRVTAFRNAYVERGYDHHYIALYDPGSYKTADVDPIDIPTDPTYSSFADVPFITDLETGRFFAFNNEAFQALASRITQIQPDFLVLEHPFLWPFVKRYLAESRQKISVIYSSHNVEGRLKYDILRRTGGVRHAVADRVKTAIDEYEIELCRNAQAVVAVSEEDACFYADEAGCGDRVIVIRNGIDYSPQTRTSPEVSGIFDGPYFIFIGSAYPPNIEGFDHFVLKNRLYFLPPRKSLAVCGGASDGVFQLNRYLGHLASYSERVHFFPKIDDDSLNVLKNNAHAFLLPIQTGGGSNLKTAEALVSGQWVITTSVALRSFEEYRDAPGVIVADTPAAFGQAMVDVYHRPPLFLTNDQIAYRRRVTWESLFLGAEADRFFDMLKP
jgi:glycosyltransferase involved in cell wall biosynthesis